MSVVPVRHSTIVQSESRALLPNKRCKTNAKLPNSHHKYGVDYPLSNRNFEPFSGQYVDRHQNGQNPYSGMTCQNDIDFCHAFPTPMVILRLEFIAPTPKQKGKAGTL